MEPTNTVPTYIQKSLRPKWLLPLSIASLVILVAALASGITYALVNNSNNTKASNNTANTTTITPILTTEVSSTPTQTSIVPTSSVNTTSALSTTPIISPNIKYRDDLYNSIYGGGQFNWKIQNNIKTTFSCSDGKTNNANNTVYEMKNISESKDSFYWVVKSLDSQWHECDQGTGANSEYATFIKNGKLLNIIFSSSAVSGTNTVVHFEY